MSIVDATHCRDAGHAPSCPAAWEKSYYGKRRMEPCACPCHARMLRRQWLHSAWSHRASAAIYRQALTVTTEDNRPMMLNQIAIQKDAARRALHCARNVATIYGHSA